MTEITNAREKD